MPDNSNMQISHITSLKNFGIFGNYKHNEADTKFLKFNLFFGFNGSGKSTLSRLFASLERGQYDLDHLDQQGSFDVALTDGSSVQLSTGVQNETLRGIVQVFNTDFIVKNFSWDTNTATPIAILGEDNVNLEKEKTGLENKYINLRDSYIEKEGYYTEADKALGKFQTDNAKEINEAIPKKSINKNVFKGAYEGSTYTKTDKLLDDQLNAFAALLDQDAPPPQQSTVTNPGINITDLRTALEVLSVNSLEKVAIQELEKHTSRTTWVKDGLNYHKTHNLNVCLFCGNSVKSERVNELELALSGAFERFQIDLASLRDALSVRIKILENFKSALPEKGTLFPTLQANYDVKKVELKTALDVLLKDLNSMSNHLNKKIGMQFKSLRMPKLISDKSVADHCTKADEIFKTFDSIINTHNTCCINFSTEKEEAIKKIKRHFLYKFQASFKALNKTVIKTKKAMEKADLLLTSSNIKINSIKEKMKDNYIAAIRINKKLEIFLGHKKITLGDLEGDQEGYRVYREGVAIKNGPLSEGEKTALSLCFFLTRLAEGEPLHKKIVIIDDPISSLDSNSLHQAFNLIREELKDAGQVFILTHHMSFMKETKNWFKTYAYPKTDRQGNSRPPSGIYFILESRMNEQTGKYKTLINPMPTLLARHNSEYHYLFSLVLDYATDCQKTKGQDFLMPNIMRRTLEAFLSFRCPNGNDMRAQIDYVVKTHNKQNPDALYADANKIALYRLTNEGSHLRQFNEATELPQGYGGYTQMAKALTSLIKTVDKEHFQEMEKVCS